CCHDALRSPGQGQPAACRARLTITVKNSSGEHSAASTSRVPDVSPDLPTPGWRALLAVLARLPQPGLSRAFGRLADLRIPAPLRRPILGTFARAIGIDVAEAEGPVSEYETLDDFFVRRLRPGARSFPNDPDALASPVDGIVGELGTIRSGDALQAKGRSYSVARLVDDAAEAARFDGGLFITLYLSPRHYHRIHAPCGGRIIGARHMPGALLPVNRQAVNHVNDLFPRNERLVCWLDGPLGRVAVVAIGAYNVGRISAAFDATWAGPGRIGVTNRGTTEPESRRYDPPIPVVQGQELMAFHLGSTLVMLVEPARVEFVDAIRDGLEVRVGEVIARGGGSG
ncbi:MAG: archaetidylserine decarboxylase, partial [Candidatus Rokuibacteriota bacterium]